MSRSRVRRRSGLIVLATSLIVVGGALIAVAAQGDTTRVSVASNGTQGNNLSVVPDISGDGRYITFNSAASNLVTGDNNGVDDVFVRDRQTGATTRVSISSNGTQATGNSFSPAISADGRYVTFQSLSSNLVLGDTNGFADIFVKDRQTGATTRVSISSDGTQADGNSFPPAISADGRYVTYSSDATNLVVPDNNVSRDVFVHDRQTGETTRVSVASNGFQVSGPSDLPAISADGRYVTFQSQASGLVGSDNNGVTDVFVHDRQTGITTRVSVDSNGAQSNAGSLTPAISADGRYVSFQSAASNLVTGDDNGSVDVFVKDRQTGNTTRVSVASNGAQGNNSSIVSAISGDGRYVTFYSSATNLVTGDNNGSVDVFVKDRQTGNTTRVSVASTGAQANNSSFDPAISADGRYVSYSSDASNLVTGDNNGEPDIFVHQYLPDPPPPPPPPLPAEGVGVVDQTTGLWTLRRPNGQTFSFFFGNPGDVPMMGDWNCDGIATPGLYRQSDGFVYLRNTNTQGVADIRFFFGNPGDIPLAGDFDGDNCDTVSIYRAPEARWYIINELGADEGGLGAAEHSYLFGDVGDVPFVGDWNGDGIDTPGLRRFSNGFVYVRNTNSQGVADASWFYGDNGDHVFTGDYNGDDIDSIGLFRPSNNTIYLRNANSTGNADTQFQLGNPNGRPVAGTLD